MTNHQKYLLVRDDDCHWYIIPEDKKSEFDAWLKVVYDQDYDFENEEAYTQPDWCKEIDGPQSILIHAFSHV